MMLHSMVTFMTRGNYPLFFPDFNLMVRCSCTIAFGSSVFLEVLNSCSLVKVLKVWGADEFKSSERGKVIQGCMDMLPSLTL